MRKINLVFLLLVLFLVSSCSNFLNEALGLTKPSDVKHVTIYANNGTSEKIEVLMNSDFDWDSSTVDINTFLKNMEFKSWYEKLTYGTYSKLGIYNQSKATGSASEKFSISVGDKICVSWTTPITEIVFKSTNGFTSTYTFKLPKEDYVPYGESREFSLSYFTKDVTFNNWYEKLYTEGKYKTGISTDSKSTEGSKSVKISKNSSVIFIVWSTQKSGLKGFTIHPNNNKYKDFYFEFDTPISSSKTIYWKELCDNEDFVKWFEDLKDDSKYKYRISSVEDDSKLDSSNKYYYIESMNYDDTDEFTNVNYNLYINPGVIEDYYVQWKEYVSEVIIDANISSISSGTDNVKTYTYKFATPKKRQNLTVADMANDTNFVEWINNLPTSGYQLVGVKYNEYEYKDTASILYVYSNRETITLLWEKGVDRITVHANNSTDETFEMKLDEVFSTKRFSWIDFQKNEEFIKWYQGLENGRFYTRGLSANAEMTSDMELMVQYNTSGNSIYLSKEKPDVYVQWGVRKNVSWVSFTRNGPVIWKPGESNQCSFHVYANDGSYEGSIKSLTFSTADESVATVTSWGLVEAKGYGETQIRIKAVAADDMEYESAITINVPADSVFERYDMPSKIIYDMQLTPDNSTFYMCGSEPNTGVRLYKSTDGINWELTGKGQYFMGQMGVSKDGKYVYGINNNSVYYSTDYGNIIESRQLGIDESSYKYFDDVKVSEDGKTIAAKMSFWTTNNYYRLVVSKDSGVTWKIFSFGAGQNDFKFSVSDDFSNIIVWENNGSAYYSENYGEDFSQIFRNITVKDAVLSDDGKMITAFLEENNRLKFIQTSNYGRTYEEIRNEFDFSWYSDMLFSQDRKSLFVRVGDNFFTSINGGVTWTRRNQNINSISFSNFIIGNNLDPILFYETDSYNHKSYIYKMKK
ncbi:MAG: hypothetical protein MJ182_05710 [Treponema sp.]|nr:hypothetical protein [Treponema sp.]